MSCAANACAVMLLVSGILLAQGKAKAPPPPEFAEAEAALKAVEAIGPKLVALLDDEKRPVAQRIEAATWLGRLRYAPAIPTLIQHIQLYDPEMPIDAGSDFPCQDALIDFGDAAVPSLVDAYMAVNERGEERVDVSRLNHLWMAIAQKSRPAAWTYAKGLEATNPHPDQKFKLRMEYLLDYIKPEVKPKLQKSTP